MNEELFEQIKALPQRRGEVWQGGVVRMSSWITGEEGGPYRPYLPIWVAVQARKVHAGKIVRPAQRDNSLAVSALVEFAMDGKVGGYRPGRVEVLDAELAGQLAFLREAGTEIRVVERLAAVEGVLDDMLKTTAVPGPLDAEGVTVERMRRFAEAAAAFYRAAPWQYFTDGDLLRVELPKPPRGMEYFIVLGAARSVYGLALFRRAEDYFQFRRRTDEGGSRVPAFWQLSFNTVTDITPRDADLWEDHRLPVASENAYPLALCFGGGGKVRRAGATDLAFLEGVLRALAETREAEIDSGRWQKEVETFDRCIVYKLAMPDLLNPPTYQEWLRRGYEPDRRVMERGFADMNRYFQEHPGATIDEMNETAARLFQGRSIDDLVTQPETPAEKAQDLCYQAFSTHGRRRVHLARKALETDPNCADAHVILAEQAGTLEAELDHYTQALAAAEQTLGPEIFQKGTGHFWGVTETRPYMRARFGLALTLEKAGRIEEAIGHYEQLLHLNPNDNQGARYLLMPRLLQMGRDTEAARLLKQYDEQSANWVYARALLAFRLSGGSEAARRELREAFRVNSHVPEILLKDEPLSVPSYYSPGSPEEALVCVDEIRPAFRQTGGALEWLTAEYRQWDREREARRREQIRKQKKRKGR